MHIFDYPMFALRKEKLTLFDYQKFFSWIIFIKNYLMSHSFTDFLIFNFIILATSLLRAMAVKVTKKEISLRKMEPISNQASVCYIHFHSQIRLVKTWVTPNSSASSRLNAKGYCALCLREGKFLIPNLGEGKRKPLLNLPTTKFPIYANSFSVAIPACGTLVHVHVI